MEARIQSIPNGPLTLALVPPSRMVQSHKRVRPASVVHFPLAVFAAFAGIVFLLQLVGLMILVDLGLRILASPYADDGPVITEVGQVRIANHPSDRPVAGHPRRAGRGR